MAANVLVDAGFLVALLTDRDTNRSWAVATAKHYPPPWVTCDPVISEAFYLFGRYGASSLIDILQGGTISFPFHLQGNAGEVFTLMKKYADVPMSFADACLVRMTEVLPDPVLLTTDSDFRIYRRHSRQAVPCVMPE
jgi:uncharacterized protein